MRTGNAARMPVVVLCGQTLLGLALVRELIAAGEPDVRVVVPDRAARWPLAEAGARVAVSELADAERLGAVLEGADTVLLLEVADGGEAPAAGLRDVLAAAEGSSVRRIVAVGKLANPRDLPALPATGAGPQEGPELIAVDPASPTLVADLLAAEARPLRE